ncbi:MAG: HupE/UreJ family protein [Pseudomonadota bacterium]
MRHLGEFIGALWLLAWSITVSAHEIRPAVVTGVFAAGEYRIEIQLNLEALMAEIGPEHATSAASPNARRYDALRALPPLELRRQFEVWRDVFRAGVALEFDQRRVEPRIEVVEIPAVGDLRVARLSRIALSGAIPVDARVFRWTYAAAFGPSVLRIAQADGTVVSQWITDGRTSEPYALGPAGQAPGRAATALQYLVLGFTHILPQGLDHILFVLGLFLLSLRLRPLLIQVTAFTLAHTLTLALTLQGVIALSPRIVEPLIAASIAYVAIENLLTSRLRPWRPFVVFGFGLLHGMGFAGVLNEIGLQRSEFITGLIGFNLGIELGQLAVIALAYLLLGRWFRDPRAYRARVTLPVSGLIALTGVYWAVSRAVF